MSQSSGWSMGSDRYAMNLLSGDSAGSNSRHGEFVSCFRSVPSALTIQTSSLEKAIRPVSDARLMGREGVAAAPGEVVVTAAGPVASPVDGALTTGRDAIG